MDLEQIKNIKINFILTTARTGSTLLSTMLNMHPNVLSTIEEPFAYYLYPKYCKIKTWSSEIIQEFCNDFYLFSEENLEVQFGSKRDFITALEKHKPYLTAEIAIKIAYLCFFPIKDKNEITTIVDKQLKFHHCLERVARFYPQSKFIILHRDPRDNAYTKWRMYEKTKTKTEQNYYKIARSWKYIYGRLIFFKYKIGQDRFLEIKYEDLVSDPEQELKKICSFIDVPFKMAMLDYDQQLNNLLLLNKEKYNPTAKLHEGLTKKVNTDKIGYWRQGLKKQEADLIWTICGSLAEKIGYQKDSDFIKQKITFQGYLKFIVFFKNRIISILYHASPFFIKHGLKKIKYGTSKNIA